MDPNIDHHIQRMHIFPLFDDNSTMIGSQLIWIMKEKE